MKAAHYLALRETGLSKVELKARLGCDEKEVRRRSLFPVREIDELSFELLRGYLAEELE